MHLPKNRPNEPTRQQLMQYHQIQAMRLHFAAV